MTVLASLRDACVTTFKVGAVVLGLTVAFEILRTRPWIRRFTPAARGLGVLGLGRGAAASLAAGVVLGIVYGAGVMIPDVRSGRVPPRQAFLLALFLCTCHAVIEDTLLFAVLGGRAFWILVPRLALALVLTSVLARILSRLDKRCV